MNFFAFSGLVIVATTIFVACSVLTKRNHINVVWAIFTLSVGMWGVGSFLIGMSKNPEQALLSWHIGYIGTTSIPIFFNHFVHIFLQREKKWWHKLEVWLVYGIGIVFAIFNWTGDIFIRDVRFIFNELYFMGPTTKIYNVFFVFFFVVVIFNLVLLFRAYQSSQGIVRKKIWFVLIGTAMGFGGGSVPFLPHYYIDVYPWPNIFIALGAIVISYGVFRYRLMDIKLTFQNSLVRFFCFLLSMSIVAIVFYFILFVFNKNFLSFEFASGALGMILAAILYPSLYKFFHPHLMKTFSPKEFLAKKRLKQMQWWMNMTQKPTMKSLYGKMIQDITAYIDVADPREIRIYLFDMKERRYYLVHPQLEAPDTFIKTDTCLSYELEKKPEKIFVIDELHLASEQAKEYNDRYGKLTRELKDLKIQVLVPLSEGGHDGEVGMITLGKKKHGKPYSTQDIEFLYELVASVVPLIKNTQFLTWYKEKGLDASKYLEISHNI